MSERWKLVLLVGAFALAFFLPIESPRMQGALLEGFWLLKDYARQHVILCLVPAFFIAGAIGQFVSQGAVLRYLGAKAPRPVAYGVASISGSILAVCSCTVLPLFASIYRRGAGLGPATAFLYSGPAINVLAMILTARVLGLQLGLARAIGAVAFAFVVGILMALFFRREEAERQRNGADPFAAAAAQASPRQPWQDALFLGTMVAILVFANWGASNQAVGFFAAVYRVHFNLRSDATDKDGHPYSILPDSLQLIIKQGSIESLSRTIRRYGELPDDLHRHFARHSDNPETVGDDRLLLADSLVLQVQKYNGKPIGLVFPPIITMAVADCEPGVRGDTASGGVTKNATLESGLVIRVPLFIKEGEKVKVHSETREFAGRV